MRIVFARETFIAGHVTVIAGSHWSADDPLVKAHKDLFTDDLSFGISSTTPVEQATAGPGERRTRASHRASD